MQTITVTVIARVERRALIEDATILGAHEHTRNVRRAPALRIDGDVLRKLTDLVTVITGVIADRGPARAALLHARAGSVRIDGVGHESSEHGSHR